MRGILRATIVAAVLASVVLSFGLGAGSPQAAAGYQGNVLAIDQSTYTTEQSNFTVSLQVANSTGIQFVYFTFCQLSSPLCYLPVAMTPHGGNWYSGTTKPMTQYSGMTVGVRAGYNITIEYSGNVNLTEPAVPNTFTNLTIASSVTGEYMFQMTVMNQVYGLSGLVTDSVTGAGIAGATVSLAGANSSTATTSSTGAYSFTQIPNGSYSLSVAEKGYKSVSENVSVNGQSVVRDVALVNPSESSGGTGSQNHAAPASFYSSPTGLGLLVAIPVVAIVAVAFVVRASRRKTAQSSTEHPEETTSAPSGKTE
jgi:carboxypeptidase family protein